MKRKFCILMIIVLLISLCGCSKPSNDSYSSDEIEIIIHEDETVYEEDDTVVSNNSTSNVDEVSSQVETTSQTSSEDNQDISVDNSSVDSSDSSVNSSDNVVTSSKVEENTENVCRLNKENVLKNIKLNGRCQKLADGVGLNHTACAIEFNTDSNNVLLEITADAGVYYSVFVDGKLTKERCVTESGTNYIALARGLSDGVHNIKFVRENESRGGHSITAVNLQLDEGKSLLEKDSDKILIEFLGDSMTSGYGNLANSTTPNASDLKNQNSLKAYPYLIIDHFDFDYRILSMSGIALKERTINGVVYPPFYDFYKVENYYADKTLSYTSSNSQDVDIVVINLGTNDVFNGSLSSKDISKVEEYTDIYTNLITDIGYRKDVKIVFVSGVMSCHDQISSYQGAKTKLNSLGYTDVYMYDCLSYNSGGGGHPSADEHSKVADALIKFFKDNKIA